MREVIMVSLTRNCQILPFSLGLRCNGERIIKILTSMKEFTVSLRAGHVSSTSARAFSRPRENKKPWPTGAGKMAVKGQALLESRQTSPRRVPNLPAGGETRVPSAFASSARALHVFVHLWRTFWFKEVTYLLMGKEANHGRFRLCRC